MERALLAAVDVETTGFGKQDRVIELGVVAWYPSSGKRSTFSTLVNPERAIPARSSAVHGIHDSDVVSAPTFAQIAGWLRPIFERSVLVAHNASFDMRMLSQELGRLGVDLAPAAISSVCTLELSRRLLPTPDFKLQTCCDELGVEIAQAHCALDDAVAVADLLTQLIEREPAAYELVRAQVQRQRQAVVPAGLETLAGRAPVLPRG